MNTAATAAAVHRAEFNATCGNHMPATPRMRHLLTAAALLLLAACAGTPPAPEEDIAVSINRSALAKESKGDFSGASQIWLQAATQHPERRQAFQLEAAKALYRGGDIKGSTELVNALLREELSAPIFTDVRILTAQIGLDTAQYEIALDALKDLDQGLSSRQRLTVLDLRLKAHKALGNQADLLETLDQQIRQLLDPTAVKRNSDSIWETMTTMNDANLRSFASSTQSKNLRAWAELVFIGRRFGLNPIAMRNAIVGWQSKNPQHLGNFGFVDQLAQLADQPSKHPENITVLLPLSGRLAVPGQAIRDGIMAAYYRLPGSAPRPSLNFVDTAKTEALTAYLTALEEGTQAIIGPLTKAELTKIAVSGELPIPILGLNRLPSTVFAPENLYQFGLAPEDDAEAVAKRALEESLTRALVLVPDSDWGRRVSQAFKTRFEEGGGQALAIEAFGEKMTDFATPLKALLGLTESNDRKRNLQAITGSKMEFEPRRRQDTDLVFLAANARQARLIRPLLQFHRASDVPLFASSHVFTGVIDAEADKDMNGLEFCDIPWIIGNGEFAAQRTRLESYWPSSSRHARLQALGFDAFNTLPVLGRLKGAQGKTIKGATGEIYSDENGVVHRYPAWARFENGVARKIELVSNAMPDE